MKYFILTISLFLSMSIYAQVSNKNYGKRVDIDRDTVLLDCAALTKALNAFIDIDRDTLLLDGKIYLLEHSFIKSFDAYRNLFTGKEVLIMAIPETKGYVVTWIVKEGILYFDHLWFDHLWLANQKGYGTTKLGEKPHEIIKDSISLAEIQHRLELLTGRKFNSKGLLNADWVTGPVKADANGHYVGFIDSSTYKSDDHYIFTFEEGKLQSSIKL